MEGKFLLYGVRVDLNSTVNSQAVCINTPRHMFCFFLWAKIHLFTLLPHCYSNQYAEKQILFAEFCVFSVSVFLFQVKAQLECSILYLKGKTVWMHNQSEHSHSKFDHTAVHTAKWLIWIFICLMGIYALSAVVLGMSAASSHLPIDVVTVGTLAKPAKIRAKTSCKDSSHPHYTGLKLLRYWHFFCNRP